MAKKPVTSESSTTIAPPAGAAKRLLRVVCGELSRKVSIPQFSGAEWQVDTVDLTYTGSSPNLNLLAKKHDFEAVLMPYTLHALTPEDGLEALKLIRNALRIGGAVNLLTFDLQRLGELIATGRQEEPALKSNTGDFSAIDMIYGPRRAEVRTVFHNSFSAITLGRVLKQANYSQIRVRRDQFNLLAAGVRVADTVNLSAEKLHIIDDSAPRGFLDDLEVAPQRWQSPGLKGR